MSRGILFRGQQIDNKEWVFGYLFCCWGQTYIIRETIKNEPVMKEVVPETVCQYTGLTDKNGRKIFEGDIVSRTDLHNAKEPSVGFIEYDTENTSFLIHWTDVQNYSATFPWKDKIEVIGNIFDTPELLEGE